jgi:hypothetical protein
MDAFAAPAENIVPRSLSKEHGPLLVLVCLPFLVGIIFWVRERRILHKLAIKIQNPELYWPLSGTANSTDLEIRPRAHEISETPC